MMTSGPSEAWRVRESAVECLLTEFEKAGFRYYEAPGVPSPGVLLISPGRINSRAEWAEGPVATALYHVFGPREPQG
jgi:hypothetical protein